MVYKPIFRDPAARTETVVDRLGNATTYGYDAHGWITEAIDALGRTVKVIDPLGNALEYTYDADQIAVRDPLGNVTQSAFDANNRVTRTTFADGTNVSYAYDANGRRTSTIDQNGYETKYGYDSLGRLVSVTDALGNVTRYEYNESGRMTAQIDAKGRTTRFAYDGLGRLMKKALPLGQKETCIYNSDGTIKGKTDFNGHITSFAQDLLTSLLLSQIYHNGTWTAYAYHPDDRLKTATAPAGLSRLKRTEYGNGTESVCTYDALSRLKELTNRKIGGAVIASHKYTLDPPAIGSGSRKRTARSNIVTARSTGSSPSTEPRVVRILQESTGNGRMVLKVRERRCY